MTVGHNPYSASLGLCKDITLSASVNTESRRDLSIGMLGSIFTPYLRIKKSEVSSEYVVERRKFLDEFMFDKCFKSARPFTK